MIQTIVVSVMFLLLIWVSAHDIRTHKIENYVHPIIIALGFLINNLGVTERLAGALICFLPFIVSNIISGNGIGMGDVKLVTAFGFVLGWYGGLAAAIAGLILMLLTNGIYQKIKKINKAVPLAPFLCGGFAFILIGTLFETSYIFY